MSQHVPDFELDDIYSFPASSGVTSKSSKGEEDIMELVWENGQIVTHSQNQRSGRRSSDRGEEAVAPIASSEIRSVVEQGAPQQDHLFMQEEEMGSWLHYPLYNTAFERDISQYFNPPPPPPLASTVEPVSLPAQLSQHPKLTTSTELNIQPTITPTRPPMLQSWKQKVVVPEPPPRKRVQNFLHFKKLPSATSLPKESTVVASNDTPKSINDGAGTSTREVMLTSSTGDSSATMSASVEPPVHALSGNEVANGGDRKRKGREADDNDSHSLDNESEFGDEKKQVRGSTSTKRSRAAEVHNLSERKRRDRINERMKTLQELIPCCNKTDKASMLDEAIEYLKSLQMQLQMITMGCGMVPIMYPGVQPQTMVPMNMSMNRPVVPYYAMVQGSPMPNPAAGAQMVPRFPMPAFQMPVVHDQSINPMAGHNPHPNFTIPYQHYLGPQLGQVSIQQNQTTVQNNDAKPSTSREDGIPENHQPGASKFDKPKVYTNFDT